MLILTEEYLAGKRYKSCLRYELLIIHSACISISNVIKRDVFPSSGQIVNVER